MFISHGGLCLGNILSLTLLIQSVVRSSVDYLDVGRRCVLFQPLPARHDRNRDWPCGYSSLLILTHCTIRASVAKLAIQVVLLVGAVVGNPSVPHIPAAKVRRLGKVSLVALQALQRASLRH